MKSISLCKTVIKFTPVISIVNLIFALLKLLWDISAIDNNFIIKKIKIVKYN